MSSICAYVTVKEGTILPSHGEVTALSVIVFSRTNYAAFMECGEIKHASLVDSVDANGTRSWRTNDEHHTPLPPLLCELINRAIDDTASTLQVLAHLEHVEVAR